MARRRMPEDGQQIYDALGDAVRRARVTAGKTQQWLADAAGIKDQTTLSDYERGRSRIALEIVRRVEVALGLDGGELLVEAGLVDRARVPVNTSTEQAIDDDEALDEDARATMHYAYRYCVKVSRFTIVSEDAASARGSADRVEGMARAATGPPANGDPHTRRSA